MGEILKLSKEIVERISAGEVIERPVSIFKELVENSIDAKSSDIIVKIYKGGKEKIVVEDNGDGILFEDLSSLFIRFATSKIKNIDDIDRITSLGFRGEALASISAISNIKIISKSKKQDIGGIIEASFSKVSKPKIINCNYGTSVIVENIFDNYPARKRFLKNQDVELHHILNWFNAFALANQNVSFQFFKDEEPRFLLKKNNSVTERIESIFGRDVLNNLEFLNFSDGDFNITIYFHRGISNSLENFNYIFVNKRYIKNLQFSYILRQAITGFISLNNKFSYVMFIEAEPSNVDVNVHPAKVEVKFKNFSILSDLIIRNLRGYLEKSATFINLETSTIPFTQSIQPSQTLAGVPQQQSNTIEGNLEQTVFFDVTNQVVAQLFNSYIFIQNKDHIALYDQHALSERLLLTKLIDKILNKEIEIQNLSIPIFVEVDSEIVEWLKTMASVWNECGFFYKIVNSTQIKLEGLPTNFSNMSQIELSHAFKKAYISNQKEFDKKELYYHLLKDFACKNAIKQGDTLMRKEMLELVNSAEKKGLYTCIHGRPVKLILSINTLEKFFQRT